MPRARLLVLTLLLTVLAGCAGASSGPRSGRSDVLTEEQLRSRGFSSVYDAVETLRSNWLRERGADSMSPGSSSRVQVYVDATRMGGVETLRQISPLSVGYVQWYNANDATARWGIGHGAGVIYVSTAPLR